MFVIHAVSFLSWNLMQLHEKLYFSLVGFLLHFDGIYFDIETPSIQLPIVCWGH